MKKAFTLVEIMIVVAIIGLLAAIGVPSFLNARKNSEDNIKLANIAAVNAAKEQWSIIENKSIGTEVAWSNIAAYIGGSITSPAGMAIGGIEIKPNPIGTSASY